MTSERAVRGGRGLILALAMVLVQVSGCALAQTFRGGIHGTVEDPSGALLPGAEVKAEDDATAQVYSSVTTSAGEFTFQDLPVGSYTVSVKLAGFEPLRVSQLKVQAGSIHSLSQTPRLPASSVGRWLRRI